MQRVKLAFVGCGQIAQSHLRGLQAADIRIDVTAAVDVDAASARAVAEQTGAQVFTSLDEALDAGDFDAVDIMLPHALHEAATVQALEAGRHVVLEKPMAPTLDACERILSAAARAGTVFMVAEQSQYWTDAVRVRDLINAGAIGEIITARACFGAPLRGRRPGRAADKGRPWRFDMAQAGGGIVMDGGAHWIRPLRMWLGEIEAVTGITARPLQDMDGETLARALCRFETGVVAAFDASWAGSFVGPGEDFRVTGSEGELLIEKGGQGRLLHYHGNCPEGEVLLADKEPGRSAAFAAELADFASAILDGEPLVAGPEVSLGELRTALAIYRSADSGQWERVWD